MYTESIKHYTNMQLVCTQKIKVLCYLTCLLFIEIIVYFQTILKHYFLLSFTQQLIKSVNRLSLTSISFVV